MSTHTHTEGMSNEAWQPTTHNTHPSWGADLNSVGCQLLIRGGGGGDDTVDSGEGRNDTFQDQVSSVGRQP